MAKNPEPVECPAHLRGRWLIAGTRITDPYPRYLPRRTATIAAEARVGELAPCVRCGGLALMRHPGTGEPCHKTCPEGGAR